MTNQLRLTVLLTALWAVPSPALAGPVDPPPPLPAPGGTIVNVSTVAQLNAAIAAIRSNTTIVLAPGTYTLTSTLWINGTYSNIGVRGATNRRDDVVLAGAGMTGAIQHGIWTGGAVQGVTIANLTIRDVSNHPIMLNGGTEDPVIYNVRLINAGQQFIKANPDATGGGVDRGRVEYSVMEYTATARDYYTNGVDVHRGTGWVIRHNLFRNLRAPSGQLAGPAILMWNSSSNTLVEGNTFIDCQREISMGLIDQAGRTDHSGGIVRNNFVYRSSGVAGDTAILVADSPNTTVVHNTVLLNDGYPSPIEYRFAQTTGTVIANNLINGVVQARDGATGSVSGNYTQASAALFVSPAAGDLRLRATATAAIDKAAASTVADDWEGDARPQGAARDVGADEYRAAATTPPAPGAPSNVRIR